MANKKRLIYAEDAKRAIEHADPAFSYVIDYVPDADAVMLPPVQIGDTAYFIINGKIYEAQICILQWYKHPNGVIDEIRGNVVGGSVGAHFSDWGKSVFQTREEADTALAERSNSDA